MNTNGNCEFCGFPVPNTAGNCSNPSCPSKQTIPIQECPMEGSCYHIGHLWDRLVMTQDNVKLKALKIKLLIELLDEAKALIHPETHKEIVESQIIGADSAEEKWFKKYTEWKEGK
jgi:hypothetical protein